MKMAAPLKKPQPGVPEAAPTNQENGPAPAATSMTSGWLSTAPPAIRLRTAVRLSPGERHADAVADRVAAGASAEDLLDQAAPGQQGPFALPGPAIRLGQGAGMPGTPVIQRKLRFRGKAVESEDIEKLINWLTFDPDTDDRKTLPGDKWVKGHTLYKETKKKAFAHRQLQLLNLLLNWVNDDVDDETRTFAGWSQAVQAANRHLTAEASRSGLSEEQTAERKRKLEELLGESSPDGEGTSSSDEDEAMDEEQMGMMVEGYPELLSEASQATDAFDVLSSPKPETSDAPLPVKRRKMHKSGVSDLPGYEVGYRTYKGYISPKPNAFVLGELAQDYEPLLDELVKLIQLETTPKDGQDGHPLDNSDVARLFLREFGGEDAFGIFSAEAQRLAHKVIAIIFFAELSRHSIALVSAAAAFHAVAKGYTKASLSEVFGTGSEEIRAPFAGTGGAELMRGSDTVKDMGEKEVRARRATAALDISRFVKDSRLLGEDLGAFVRRRTLEYVLNLSKQSSEPYGMAVDASREMYARLRKLKQPKKDGDGNPLTLLGELGFAHHAQDGDQNDCAIQTIYHQLTHRGVAVGDFNTFRDYVRHRAGLAFGSMINLLTSGHLLLQAVQQYLTENDLAPNAHLIIDVWSATTGGGLMEFQDVAAVNGDGARYVLTFYFNGVNHFDSITGALARN